MTKGKGTLSLFTKEQVPRTPASGSAPVVDTGPREGGRPPGPPGPPDGTLTVSAVLLKVERALFQHVGDVVVVGELSSVRPWRTGHLYFDLKDPRSFIGCMMRDGYVTRLPFTPKEGMKVVATGRIAYYRPQGKVQLVVTKLEPVGEGLLLRRLEELKAKLLAEGLFDNAKKKQIPRFPTTVGLVTSPQGAVLRDMIKVLRQRSPGINIVLSSTRVQGEGAEKDIAIALSRLDQSGLCDVILVGRGGGSFEDLMPFQSEIVVRTIAKARTPIIASVGHETDVTLADLAASVRAATPSHAAELAVTPRTTLSHEVKSHAHRLFAVMRARLDRARHRLHVVERKMKDPREVLSLARDDLEERARALTFLVEGHIGGARSALSALTARLEARRPDRALTERRARLVALDRRLVALALPSTMALARRTIGEKESRLAVAVAARRDDFSSELRAGALRLDALSPLRVLDRGYTLVKDESGHLVSRAVHVETGAVLDVRFSDGIVRARALSRSSLTSPSLTTNTRSTTDGAAPSVATTDDGPLAVVDRTEEV
jgi:exodeoxyribonuclease VII large subunit